MLYHKIKKAQRYFLNPNPDLEIFIYELPELLNDVIANALFRHCENPVIASAAKKSRFRLVSFAGVSYAGLRLSVRPIFARNDWILEFIKYFLNRNLG